MSTQHRDQIILRTKLERVTARSKQDNKAEFNNLGHIIDIKLLEQCFCSLDGNKAIGIDKVTKAEYGKELNENLQRLLKSIRSGSYHPKPSRIVEIPKADGTMRPLAISCLEDKIVQECIKRILESIYEPIFSDVSHGFRPGRGCETALVALNKALMGYKCGAVLEIDLRKYFNTIPHEPLERMLRLKIKDVKFLHLVLKLLKAPIVDKNGDILPNNTGSPQGSIVSPVLANIYLHYVLDLWFEWVSQNEMGGNANLIRYADDAVFTLYNLRIAESFKIKLKARLEKFGISLHEEKTKAIICGSNMASHVQNNGLKMPHFTFLGFLHVWGKARNRKTGKIFWRVKLRTCPIRFRKKLRLVGEYIKSHRHDCNLIPRVKAIVCGYLNYFAINDNGKRSLQFLHEIRRMLFKWLNRRSQKKSFTWGEYRILMDKLKFPSSIKTKSLFFAVSKDGTSFIKC